MKEKSVMKEKQAFGIVVSGGPAPGINCVISAVIFAAIREGYKVKGLRGGFKDLSTGAPDSVMELTTEIGARIYNTGGSLLGTSRFNPFSNPTHRDTFLRGLKENGIDKLIVIGGDGSAYLSYQLSKCGGDLRVVHVPKTIDNDLILPNQYPSFGFETARYVGTKIVDTLCVDARTTRRWFLVTSMGRKAGFLAMGLGIASGATLTLIPEEFSDRLYSAEEIARVLFASIEKRAARKKDYGIAIIAEGLLDRIDPQTSSILKDCPRDHLGRLEYSQVELGDVILPALRGMLSAANQSVKIIPKNIGYELRCHEPVSFDIEYTRFLGFGAVCQLIEGKTGVMVTREFENLGSEPLEQLIQPDGSIRSRCVDLKSDLYKAARSFMIR